MIAYAREQSLSAADFAAVLRASGEALTRPVDDVSRLQAMLDNADLIVTARDENGAIVGVARCVTDFAWTCYCAELAVAAAGQGRGIGKRLIETCREILGDDVAFVLLSVPEAVSFYQHIGMQRAADAFYFQRVHGA